MTTSTFSSAALSWLLTYSLHSTTLLGLAWLASRTRRMSPGASEVVWKFAMIGGLITASVQLGLDWRPRGTVALRSAPSVMAIDASAAVPARELGSVKNDSEHEVVGVEAGVATLPVVPPAESTSFDWPARETVALFAWSFLALLLGGSFAARRLILVGRLGDREQVHDGSVVDMLRELARDTGVSAPRLTITDRVSSPIALGRSEVCLPRMALTDLDTEQQRSMLAHELAHLARRDPMWLGIASMVERLFKIQPLNRIARREISTAAEFLCDEWAVRRTGGGVALASCIAQVAEWIQASPLGVPVAGMAEERSLLVTRVSRLLEERMPVTRSRRVITLTAASVVLGTIVMVPRVSGTPLPPRESVAGLQASVAGLPEDQAPVASDAMQEEEAPIGLGKPAGPVLTPADSAVVVALIARLKDEDAEVRAAAAHALGKLEDARAVPGLIAALRDSNKHVRAASAEALSQFRDSRAINALVNALSDASTEVRQNALEALSGIEEGVSAAPIIRMLDDKDADVRHKAVHILGRLKDQSAAPGLVRALRDTSADVRSGALEALVELRAGIPEATMISLMRDRNSDVRQRAAHLAGERSLVGMVSTLVSLLEDSDADVRQAAVEALGEIPADAAHLGLRKALNSKDPKVRKSAVEALGERRKDG